MNVRVLIKKIEKKINVKKKLWNLNKKNINDCIRYIKNINIYKCITVYTQTYAINRQYLSI